MDAKDALARLAENGIPADPATTLRLSVGLDDVLGRLERETLPYLAAGGAELRFFVGDYGRGKSHMLQAMGETARLKGFVTAHIQCGPGERPFESFATTYQAIARNITPPSNTGGRTRGPAAVIQSGLEVVSEAEGRKRLDGVRDSPHLSRDFRNVVYALGNHLRAHSGGRELGDRLRALLSGNTVERTTIGDLYRSDPALPRPLGRLAPRTASGWLRSLCALPAQMGFPGLLVLFDEAEQRLSLNNMGPRERQRHLANLRNLVDHVAVGGFRSCAIYYAVLDDFVETARLELEALTQRIERMRVSDRNGEAPRNPRAVWGELDELTVPGPRDLQFFHGIVTNLRSLATDAGVPERRLKAQDSSVVTLVNRHAASNRRGAVREFVKAVAGLYLAEAE
jgi:hypothetical protein